jgi:predicted RNA-binding Zn ribbon-like protein
MAFDWKPHHFINGVPCLDLANTIVWRDKPERREDRLQALSDVAGWCRAYSLVHKVDLPRRRAEQIARVREIRSVIDGFFRYRQGWARLVGHYAQALRRNDAALELTLLDSAFRLYYGAEVDRVKVCGNCGWLFIDRTRNQNKRWCIAELCGSRTKARRYYQRRKARAGT